MLNRNPRRAWPLLVIVGIPSAAILGMTQLIAALALPDATPSVVACLVVAAVVTSSAYTWVFGPSRGRATLRAVVALAAFGLVLWLDARRAVNALPPGWPSGLPRYPGAWTGLGSALPGEPAWFKPKVVGRTSRYEVAYDKAWPAASRQRDEGDCSVYVIDGTRVVVCPEGPLRVVRVEPAGGPEGSAPR